MTERRVTEIVRQRGSLGQVLIEPKRASQRAGDLRDLQRVREPGAVVVALVRNEDLGLVRKAAEGGGMDDAVAVAPEIAAGAARWLGVKAPAARPRIGRIGRARAGRRDRHDCLDCRG